MAAEQNEKADSKTSSDTDEKGVGTPSETALKDNDEYENLKYPESWQFEKWFVGGYSQGRMIKFKSPKTMYKAINLFAGMTTRRHHTIPQANSGFPQVLQSCSTATTRV